MSLKQAGQDYFELYKQASNTRLGKDAIPREAAARQMVGPWVLYGKQKYFDLTSDEAFGYSPPFMTQEEVFQQPDTELTGYSFIYRINKSEQFDLKKRIQFQEIEFSDVFKPDFRIQSTFVSDCLLWGNQYSLNIIQDKSVFIYLFKLSDDIFYALAKERIEGLNTFNDGVTKFLLKGLPLTNKGKLATLFTKHSEQQIALVEKGFNFSGRFIYKPGKSIRENLIKKGILSSYKESEQYNLLKIPLCLTQNELAYILESIQKVS